MALTLDSNMEKDNFFGTKRKEGNCDDPMRETQARRNM
jgi:hypothetical protein